MFKSFCMEIMYMKLIAHKICSSSPLISNPKRFYKVAVPIYILARHLSFMMFHIFSLVTDTLKVFICSRYLAFVSLLLGVVHIFLSLWSLSPFPLWWLSINRNSYLNVTKFTKHLNFLSCLRIFHEPRARVSKL